MPAISIIIPAYNDPIELDLCLDALQQSELKNQFEIIVIDDCSPDEGTAIEQAARKYKVRFYRLDVNGGPGVARNRGAKEAKGSVLVFIDSDCAAQEGWLSKLVQPIRDGRFVATTSCYCGPVNPGWITTFQDEDYWYRMPSDECDVSFVNSCNFAVDRKVYFDCGGFPEQRIAHDMVLGLVLSERGTPARYLPEAGVKHGYCGDINSYLRQRYSFAFNTVKSILNRNEMQSTKAGSSVRSFNPLRTALGMFFVAIAMISFFCAGISAVLGYDLAASFLLAGLSSLFLEAVVHGKFLLFLTERQGLKRSVSYIFLLYVIDFVYAYAVLKALTAIRFRKNSN